MNQIDLGCLFKWVKTDPGPKSTRSWPKPRLSLLAKVARDLGVLCFVLSSFFLATGAVSLFDVVGSWKKQWNPRCGDRNWREQARCPFFSPYFCCCSPFLWVFFFGKWKADGLSLPRPRDTRFEVHSSKTAPSSGSRWPRLFEGNYTLVFIGEILSFHFSWKHDNLYISWH